MKRVAVLTPAQLDVDFKLLKVAFSRLRVNGRMTAGAVVLFGGLMWRRCTAMTLTWQTMK